MSRRITGRLGNWMMSNFKFFFFANEFEIEQLLNHAPLADGIHQSKITSLLEICEQKLVEILLREINSERKNLLYWNYLMINFLRFADHSAAEIRWKLAKTLHKKVSSESTVCEWRKYLKNEDWSIECQRKGD